jgi:hypothetical protein
MFALLFATVVAVTSLPASLTAPAPTPSPSPLPSAAPAFTFSGVFSDYYLSTMNANATGALDTNDGTDLGSRSDINNALLSYTKNTGVFRYGVTAGLYAFPVVGQAVNPTAEAGANTDLYSWVPQIYIAYAPTNDLTISIGKLATLLGQEDGFTYQNPNIQRGLAWNAEPAFSRGIRAAYTKGKFTGDLEFNDGFYSGDYRAVEGLLGWAPSGNTDVQFAFLLPDRDTPGNPTASIANKAEYDVMVTQTFGKLQVLPYFLAILSPSDAGLDYTVNESADAGVMIVTYAFNQAFSLAGRYEDFVNHSIATETSANADFLGYGPGSRATSLTLTPQYKFETYFTRAEFSQVEVSSGTPGLMFGPAGTATRQYRFVFEAGDQF